MSILIVGSEKNFAALRSRLFTGSVSTKVAGEVLDAIQAANPGADLKALQPGTVLNVPDDLPHVAVLGNLSLDDNSKRAVIGLVTDGDATLTHLASTARSRASDAATERKQLAKTLAGKQLAAAASKDKQVAASLKAARDALAAANAQAAGRADALAQAQAEWGSELAALKATLPS
jgi:hypothetical protein